MPGTGAKVVPRISFEQIRLVAQTYFVAPEQDMVIFGIVAGQTG